MKINHELRVNHELRDVLIAGVLYFAALIGLIAIVAAIDEDSPNPHFLEQPQ